MASSQTESHERLFRQIEDLYGIPPYLLMAIALKESGRPIKGERVPWPWALNVEGKSFFFDTRKEAERAIDKAIQLGQTFDVGLMQQNWKWQKHRYLKPYDMLEPVLNVRGAAQTLVEWYKKTGNWVDAIGQYHAGTISSNSERRRAQRYVVDVWRHHLSLLGR